MDRVIIGTMDSIASKLTELICVTRRLHNVNLQTNGGMMQGKLASSGMAAIYSYYTCRNHLRSQHCPCIGIKELIKIKSQNGLV